MHTNRYEKYVGYNKSELKYKKEMVKDEVSGNMVEKLVERTPEEVEAYIIQKESEFDKMVETWERLGIDKCALRKNFNDEKFANIILKLAKNRLEEIKNMNQNENVEQDLLNSFDDVDKKYNISSAFKYYNVDNFYLTSYKLFKDAKKSDMEKMFYKNISTESAEMLARNRFEKATTINEGVALIQELQKTHDNRSFFFKVFHPFKNHAENVLIREMKENVMQKFNISNKKLERKLETEIDTSSLKSSELYKINDFVNTYCLEKSGKIYSQKAIDEDRQSVDERADDDFVKSQNDLNKIVEAESREPIVIDDAKKEEDGRVSEPVKEDPLIIKVPNNDGF